MALRRGQIEEAERAQHAAAHDEREHVRVVAGPGTGKSATIEERVCWLLERGVKPGVIVAISFTRAAARDLERRIAGARAKRGLDTGPPVAASTLHSLALRVLRQANALVRVPGGPGGAGPVGAAPHLRGRIRQDRRDQRRQAPGADPARSRGVLRNRSVRRAERGSVGPADQRGGAREVHPLPPPAIAVVLVRAPRRGRRALRGAYGHGHAGSGRAAERSSI